MNEGVSERGSRREHARLGADAGTQPRVMRSLTMHYDISQLTAVGLLLLCQ